MLKRLAEGRYNTNDVEKDKYKKTRYRSVYVFKDEQKNVIRFEGNYFSEIEGAVQDVIRYLNAHNLEKNYILTFNNVKISICADSNADLLIHNYLNDYEEYLFGDKNLTI